jgi:hypothetical protein
LPRVVSLNAAFVGAPPQATRRETLIHRPLVSGDSSTAASAVPAWALAVENRSGRALLQENRPLMGGKCWTLPPLGAKPYPHRTKRSAQATLNLLRERSKPDAETLRSVDESPFPRSWLLALKPCRAILEPRLPNLIDKLLCAIHPGQNLTNSSAVHRNGSSSSTEPAVMLSWIAGSGPCPCAKARSSVRLPCSKPGRE